MGLWLGASLASGLVLWLGASLASGLVLRLGAALAAEPNSQMMPAVLNAMHTGLLRVGVISENRTVRAVVVKAYGLINARFSLHKQSTNNSNADFWSPIFFIVSCFAAYSPGYGICKTFPLNCLA